MRKFPALEITQKLRERDTKIEYLDPFLAAFPKMRRYVFNLSSIPLEKETLNGDDSAVIATVHDLFDYELMASEAPLVVDTRSQLREKNSRVFPA